MITDARLALQNDRRHGRAFTQALNDEQFFQTACSNATAAHERSPSETSGAELARAQAALADAQQRVAHYRRIFDQTERAVPTAARGNPALAAANPRGVRTRPA